MIIKKSNVTVVHVHDDELFYTIVKSYKNYDTVEPVYTIIREDAHASPVMVQTNKKAKAVNDYFGHNVTALFDED